MCSNSTNLAVSILRTAQSVSEMLSHPVAGQKLWFWTCISVVSVTWQQDNFLIEEMIYYCNQRYFPSLWLEICAVDTLFKDVLILNDSSTWCTDQHVLIWSEILSNSFLHNIIAQSLDLQAFSLFLAIFAFITQDSWGRTGDGGTDSQQKIIIPVRSQTSNLFHKG